MASWLKGGRAALLEAVNKACDSIDDDVRADIRAAEFLRKKKESDELAELKKRVANIDRLEEENRQLQNTVRQLQRKTATPAATATPPPDIKSLQDENGKYPLERLKTTPEDTRETLAQKNLILVRKFQALDNNYKKVTPMYEAVKKKVKERDVTIAALEAERDHLKRQLSVVNNVQDDDDGLPQLIRRPRASSHEPSSSRGNDPADALSFSSDPGPDVAGDENGLAAPETVRTEGRRANVPPSEATTVCYDPPEPELPPLPRAFPEEHIVIKEEPSSEEPIIISERRVRKRKATEELPTPKRHIKSEDEDSGPSRIYDMPEPESLDLDEVGPRLSTPRKLRLWADEPTSGPGTARRSTGADSSRTRAVRTPSANSTRPAIESTVLTPVDANIRRKPQTVAGKLSSKSRGSDIVSGIRSLAEDGGNLYQRAVRRKTGTHLQETPGGSRLRRLLDEPGPAEEPAILRSAPPLRRDPSSLGLPPRRELPYDKNGRARPTELTPSRAAKPAPERGVLTGGFKPRADLTGSSRQNRKDQAPAPVHGALRQKDPSELRLQDFKINPKTNAGHDFAYTEVVRGRAERACLPGCIDMSCCGPEFRGLAKLEMSKRTPAEDAKLFEDYLGDGISRINGMSREEKDEEWLKAKTWQLANKQAKHRARHARRQSPPGFWNTGFPNTQEIAQEKQEAARRERDMVAERRREAMRPEGLWKFRDE